MMHYTQLMRTSSYPLLLIGILCLVGFCPMAQPLQQKPAYSLDDTLRGTLNKERDWWNVLHYTLSVQPDYASKTITGSNTIRFVSTDANAKPVMQIDLQSPMKIDSVLFEGQRVAFEKRGKDSWLVQLGLRSAVKKKTKQTLTVYFSGSPRVAKNPPWDGGWIFTKDKEGRPWMTVACQGLGASVWYPCKDHQSDEPDQGALLSVTVPDTLIAVANGRLVKQTAPADGKQTFHWQVVNPINNYNLVPYIGKYVHFKEQYHGIAPKKLDLDYWVLDYNLEKAKTSFEKDVPRMLKAFEYWFGLYPFYEDGYKLVESSHLGMEHQSAIAYGNGFKNGYRGRDLSGSGWGKDWDYIIIHESGHEWFANNITTNDIADMWIHEGFTMYSEVLFIDYHYGNKAGNEYCRGVRKNIRNDKPLIGDYGVNQEGSGDMYNKGAGLLHHIREMIGNDSVFRAILVGLNNDFRHRTVDTKQVENYFSQKAALDLTKVFDQYLRSTTIPVLEYQIGEGKIRLRFSNCIDNFKMPVRWGQRQLTLSTQWTETSIDDKSKPEELDGNYYWTLRRID
jgi:aminopeptidase N